MARRLAAILAADVVGYTRLMGADDMGTLRRLTELRQQVLEPLIAEHHGRVVKLIGDGLLVEFVSVVDALTCAVAWQTAVIEREGEIDDDKRLKFRIGINLGDVIAAGDDIHGDGVNVAARLESLADPDGIWVSGDVFRYAKGKVEADFEDMGEHELKNVAEPVRIYRIAPGRSGAVVDSTTKKALPLADKPSIAVLPFNNMSGDPEQEYFSDGITEDIITELSRFRELFVIARNSSFSYKGKSTKVQEIGKSLGVTYIVEGSVRKARNRVRITAQLVEAVTGNHIWAERYDRELEDVFDLQDEITRTIVTVLPVRLQVAMIESARRKPSENLSAYDCFLRARWLFDRTSKSFPGVLELLARAIQIDSTCAHAYAMLADVQAYSVFTFSPIGDHPTIAASENIEHALALGEGDHFVHAQAGNVYLICGMHDLAKKHIDKALALNPNDFSVLIIQGILVSYSGDAWQGLQLLREALAHDPLAPDHWSESLAETYYLLRDYEKEIEIYQRWQNPPVHMYTHLAACYAQLDRLDEALRAAKVFEDRRPKGSDFASYAAAHARLCKRSEDAEHWLEGYRKARLIV